MHQKVSWLCLRKIVFSNQKSCALLHCITVLKLSDNRHVKRYVIRQDSKPRESDQVETCFSTTILHVEYTRDNKRSQKCVFIKMLLKNTVIFQMKRF